MKPEAIAGRSESIGIGYLYQLVQDPLWYLQFDRLASARTLGMAAVTSVLKRPWRGAYELREELFARFENLLERGDVALGRPGTGLYEWDSERETIDTAVIHHSGRAEGISLARLNAMELLRLYVPVYRNPAPTDKDRIHGRPIYSGHVRDGRQVFYPYHWLIRQDGSVVRLLEDYEIGWHAGNWGINKRSVALCFDDDLEHKAPNRHMIDAAHTILREHYGWLRLDSESLLGHNEASRDTTCPGDPFLHGIAWKNTLL